MSLKSRRDPVIVDTVTLQQDTDQYIAVMRDGSIAGLDDDAFGFTWASGSQGDPVPVCRLGFSPAIVTTASDNAAAGTELQVGADGKLVALRTSGGGTAFIVGRSEMATANDGDQTGFWVDCVSLGREQSVSA